MFTQFQAHTKTAVTALCAGMLLSTHTTLPNNQNPYVADAVFAAMCALPTAMIAKGLYDYFFSVELPETINENLNTVQKQFNAALQLVTQKYISESKLESALDNVIRQTASAKVAELKKELQELRTTPFFTSDFDRHQEEDNLIERFVKFFTNKPQEAFVYLINQALETLHKNESDLAYHVQFPEEYSVTALRASQVRALELIKNLELIKTSVNKSLGAHQDEVTAGPKHAAALCALTALGFAATYYL